MGKLTRLYGLSHSGFSKSLYASYSTFYTSFTGTVENARKGRVTGLARFEEVQWIRLKDGQTLWMGHPEAFIDRKGSFLSAQGAVDAVLEAGILQIIKGVLKSTAEK